MHPLKENFFNQPAFTCSKLTFEKSEQCEIYLKSKGEFIRNHGGDSLLLTFTHFSVAAIVDFEKVTTT